MLASLAFPAQAKWVLVADTGPKPDLCIGGKAMPGTPSAPVQTHANGCEPCCSSTSTAPPPVDRKPATVAQPSQHRLPAIDLLPMPSGGLRAKLARAPPILL